MLRELRCNCADAPAAYFRAAADLKTGMGVTKDYANTEAKLPTAATSAGIYLVAKAPIPTGINTAFENFSDYEEEFNTVKEGELCVLYHYAADSTFATDQYASSITASTAAGYVQVGTDGKWVKLASGTSPFYFTGLIDDGLTHKLARIEVVG